MVLGIGGGGNPGVGCSCVVVIGGKGKLDCARMLVVVGVGSKE